jgi:hypothetical protein
MRDDGAGIRPYRPARSDAWTATAGRAAIHLWTAECYFEKRIRPRSRSDTKNRGFRARVGLGGFLLSGAARPGRTLAQ